MKDGFVRVGAASPALRVADVAYNRTRLVESARTAAAFGVKVLAFPELAITGYTAADLFATEALLSAAERELAVYIEETKELDLISAVGIPALFMGRVYDAAAVVSRGRLLGVVPKTNIRNNTDESRVFTAAPEDSYDIRLAGYTAPFGAGIIFECGSVPNLKVGVAFGSDISSAVSPAAAMALGGATVILSPAASAELVGAAKARRSLVAVESKRELCVYVYADADVGESTGECVFGGHKLVAQCGRVIAESAPFSDSELICAVADVDFIASERRKACFGGTDLPDEVGYVPFDLEVTETELTEPLRRMPFVPEEEAELNARCEHILNIQARALAARLERAYAKTCVMGISGGLDSTIALLVAARAMDILKRPRADISAITMPCFGTTARTKSNAQALAEALGASVRTVDIKAAVTQHFLDIGHDKDNFSVVYENAQARERTQVLMDVANAEGGIVLGTGDLSEGALGWSTYNGDQMSMYNVNASLPKTLIRYVVAYCADVAEAAGDATVAKTLRDVLSTPVSPELLPPKDGEIAQCTEGIVGPYELHDYFIFCHTRLGYPPAKIYRAACATFNGVYEPSVISGWLSVFVRRFFTQQFKRTASPDGAKVGSVSLSVRTDWRMPSDVSFSVWKSSLEEIEQ